MRFNENYFFLVHKNKILKKKNNSSVSLLIFLNLLFMMYLSFKFLNLICRGK